RQAAQAQGQHAAHQRERDVHEHGDRIAKVAEHQEQHREDHRQRQRGDETETLAGAGEVLELTAPLERDALRERDGVGDLLARLVDEANQVASAYVDLDQDAALQGLAVDDPTSNSPNASGVSVAGGSSSIRSKRREPSKILPA